MLLSESFQEFGLGFFMFDQMKRKNSKMVLKGV